MWALHDSMLDKYSDMTNCKAQTFQLDMSLILQHLWQGSDAELEQAAVISYRPACVMSQLAVCPLLPLM